jgi:hypothetical protein
MEDESIAQVSTPLAPRLSLGAGDAASEAPSRGVAAASLIGGALTVGGFFLPWFVIQVGQANGSLQTTTVSGWDICNHWLTGQAIRAATDGTSTSPTSPTSLWYAIVAGFPLLMGVVALAIGVTGFRRRLPPRLAGLTVSAGIMGALTMMNMGGQYVVAAATVGSLGSNPSDMSLVGSGLALVYVGIFAMIAAGLASILRPAR